MYDNSARTNKRNRTAPRLLRPGAEPRARASEGPAAGERPLGRAGRSPLPGYFPRANSVPDWSASRIPILSWQLTRLEDAFVTFLTCRLPSGHSLWSRVAYLVKRKALCDAAVLLSAFRAHAGTPPRRVPARHQLAGRAKVRVSQLLLSPDHPGRLLWGPPVRRCRRAIHRVPRLLLSGDPGAGHGRRADAGCADAADPVERFLDSHRVCRRWTR